MDNIIEINNLSKSFGTIKAVQDLSFHVKKGELFAFLGVNGAGKSTTINIMCGQLQKDAGKVMIDGLDSDRYGDEIKTKLGVVFQNSVLDSALSVYDNLECRAGLYGIYGGEFKKRLAELSELLDFTDLLKRTVGKLSEGQRRRIDVARALLNKPEILILDEPTTGLDPYTRQSLWKIMAELREKENMTVFLTTHYMEEAAGADYVVIIDSGRISAKGTPLELKNAYTGDYVIIYNGEEETVRKFGLPYEKTKDAIKVSVPDTQKATKLLLEYPEVFKDYEIIKGRMNDVFLAVTGKKLNGGNAYEDAENSRQKKY